jgi:hypothetical protein
MNSAGITIVDVSVGASECIVRSLSDSDDNGCIVVQDRTPKGANQYNGVFFFLIALKAIDVVYGLIYDVSPGSLQFHHEHELIASAFRKSSEQFLDIRFFGSVLRLNEKDRLAKESRETDADRLQGLRPARRKWTAFGLLVIVVLITTS